MSRHTILSLAAVAVVAYAIGYYRAQHAAASAASSQLATGTDWLNWQAA